MDVDLRNRLTPIAIPCEDSAIGRWDPRRCHLVDYTMVSLSLSLSFSRSLVLTHSLSLSLSLSRSLVLSFSRSHSLSHSLSARMCVGLRLLWGWPRVDAAVGQFFFQRRR